METWIHRIETLTPAHAHTQDYACQRMEQWAPNPVAARSVRAIYRRSGIERRHSVVPDFMPNVSPQLFRADADGRVIEPGTEERNRFFISAANELYVGVARAALEHQPRFKADDITHLITVSCTGFYNPGPDYQIVTNVGLPATVERYHLGFMGCYAAFPALRMAQQFCAARPEAVVLIVCVELCSLHLKIRHDPDSLLANALFADGAAAAIVSARPPMPDQPALRIDQFRSALAPEGRKDMAWDIGNHGFNIVLSSYVPDIIGANIEGIVDDLLLPTGRRNEDIDLWAIHPGGRAILDRIQRALKLQPPQLQVSREILRDYGNMSSATILFVLRGMLATAGEKSQEICAMAFGPGLTIETALLQLTPARTARETLALHLRSERLEGC